MVYNYLYMHNYHRLAIAQELLQMWQDYRADGGLPDLESFMEWLDRNTWDDSSVNCGPKPDAYADIPAGTDNPVSIYAGEVVNSVEAEDAQQWRGDVPDHEIIALYDSGLSFARIRKRVAGARGVSITEVSMPRIMNLVNRSKRRKT